ncbi:hypothetical protein FGO68_gene2862 [Halteria grandinella]|uniref:Uncharacterized protein n=1 Tax=Halteria grandinella TaxID=5974 RepID=A0A8J8T8Y3_HALGN|nr:hypothetical protein FGO68_gene2862 [Halteria grandinella]
MITMVKSQTYAWVYQFQTQCSSATPIELGQNFQSCLFEASTSSDTIVFQEGTKFFRISTQYQSMAITTSTLHDPADPTIFARGLHCASIDLVYSLMWGTYSGNSQRIFVAQASFITSKIIYTRYLQ